MKSLYTLAGKVQPGGLLERRSLLVGAVLFVLVLAKPANILSSMPESAVEHVKERLDAIYRAARVLELVSQEPERRFLEGRLEELKEK